MVELINSLLHRKFLNTDNIKNNTDYRVLINTYVLKCWGIICFVLISAYIIEVLKGLRTFVYVIAFSLFLLVPFIVCYLIRLYIGKDNLDIRYYIAIGYVIFYSFNMFTSNSIFSWCYIIPMVSVLIVYSDKKLIRDLFIAIFSLNILYICGNLFSEGLESILQISTKELITCFEIQIACILLTGWFIFHSCECLVIRDKILSQLELEIYKDTLTNSYNKKFMLEQIPKLFNEQASYSLAFIDIDDFKRFNDKYNHEFGDEVLKNTCNIISKALEEIPDTFLIRVGGDEFIVISKMKNYTKFNEILEKIREEVFFNKVKYEEELVSIHISIGIVNSIEDDCEDYLDLYRKADIKLYKAKDLGKNLINR